MKALLVREHGPVENVALCDVTTPTPRAGEVLVDVKAASVNYPDLLVIGGTYQNLPPRPFTPGKDLAGIVAAIGQGVSSCKPGDRVSAQVEFGAFAEKCVVPQLNCHVLPPTMSFEVAAAMGLTYPTAHFALVERGELRPGETVLVTGAAGGVGLATVQVAKALGARVVASVSSDAKAAQVKAAGADHVVRTDVANLREALRAQVYEAIGPQGADVIVETVGGDVFDASLRALGWCGRLVVVGFAGGRIPEVKAGYLLVKNITVMGLQWTDYRDRQPQKMRAAQQALFGMYEQGLIRPHIMASFPLREFRSALALIARREAIGKIVLTLEEAV